MAMHPEEAGIQVRYMGNEFGAMNKPFDEQEVRMTMTYPETYEVGMSNTAIPALQYILNQEAGVMCDRAYFPDADAVAMLARHNKPLFAVESKRPLCDFDALGFSLAYELGGINVLEMLKLGGVPVSSEERMQAEPSAVWNPEDVRMPCSVACQLFTPASRPSQCLNTPHMPTYIVAHTTSTCSLSMQS